MKNQIKMKVKIGEKHFLVELGQEVVITEELIKAMPDKFDVENELKFERGKVYKLDILNTWIVRIKEVKEGKVFFYSGLNQFNNYDNGSVIEINSVENQMFATPEEIALLEEADRKHGYKYNPVTMELEELPKDGEVWTFDYGGCKHIRRMINESYLYATTDINGNFVISESGDTICEKYNGKYKGGDEELAEAAKKAGKVWDEKLKKYVDIEPLFVTEDGVKMYGFSEVTPVNKETFEILPTKKYNGNSSALKYFSTIEAAKKWVTENKVKSFDDYENEFLEEATTGEYSLNEFFYQDLKSFHPKQYYQIIGQYIADDLNGDEKPDNTSSISEYIVCWKPKIGFHIEDWVSPKRGHIRFDTREIGNKFLEIMGDHLNQLY